MRRIRSWATAALFALLMGAIALGSSVRDDAKRAKKYVAEVRKHLLESYINSDELTREQLEEAGLEGLKKAMDHAKFGDLDEELRDGIRSGVAGADSVADAIDAAAEVVGDEEFDFLAFADHATVAMVQCTKDPFSRILTGEDFQKLLKMLQGGAREDSLGLGVAVRDGKATVVYVQYGYVAYEEGIRMGDEVLAVDGNPASKITQEQMATILRVKPGEKIRITIRRPGIDRDLEFRLVQRRVKPKDVHFSMLRGGIGYLRMTIFDNRLVREVRKALETMDEQGMRACVLDLRNNPGGALPACTGVADLFLDQDLLITKTVSHYTPSLGGMKLPGLMGDRQFKTRRKSAFEEIPLVLLINGASASASEMLAGAMQDHKRATLIGETTYGKGVGQTPIFLTSVFQKRYLYLTVMRYTTPKGHEVHHLGIAPDIGAPENSPAPKEFLAAWDFRHSDVLDAYIRRNWEEREDLLRELAEYDGFKTEGYPAFDRLYRSLQTTLTRDQVRRELRLAVRRHVVRETDEPYVYDLQADVQLQRAVVALLDRLGEDD